MATHEAPHPLKTSLWPFFDAVTVTSTPLLGDPQHIVGTQHEAVGWMSGRRRQRMTIRQFVAMELARLAGFLGEPVQIQRDDLAGVAGAEFDRHADQCAPFGTYLARRRYPRLENSV